jgi:NAD(P)-dependent dehydrogenase (short-subunit alcohol dehydrogenase family)
MTRLRRALITGGSSGLGRALAHELSAAGYAPVLLARDEARLQEAVAELRCQGADALGIRGDVTSAADLQDAAEAVRGTYGCLDFVILNAGVVHVGLLEELRPDELRQDIESNLLGAVLSARAFVPLLPDGGRMLLISSGFGLAGAAGYAAYCGAKAGVINFAAALRRELLHRRIAVYVACPPDIDTPQLHGERDAMPEWMQAGKGRRRALSATEAARRILRRCRGRRLLIAIDPGVRQLLLLARLLPAPWADAVLDRVLARPEASRSGAQREGRR